MSNVAFEHFKDSFQDFRMHYDVYIRGVEKVPKDMSFLAELDSISASLAQDARQSLNLGLQITEATALYACLRALRPMYPNEGMYERLAPKDLMRDLENKISVRTPEPEKLQDVKRLEFKRHAQVAAQTLPKGSTHYKHFQEEYKDTITHFKPYLDDKMGVPDDLDFLSDARVTIAVLTGLARDMCKDTSTHPHEAEDVLYCLEVVEKLSKSIGDGESLKEIEFIENELKDIKDGKKMTNAHATRNLDFNIDLGLNSSHEP